MVSKIIKKTHIKPSKKRWNPGRRRKTPVKYIKKASSIIISSINRSVDSCQRRIITIISKLTSLRAPNQRKNGFHLLKNVATGGGLACSPESPLQKPLPPPEYPAKKTVFLDLDETLVHSESYPPPEKYDFIVRPTISGEPLTFYVLKRPGVDELLEEIGKNFEIVVFTAGLREYASLVLDRLDSKRVISHRLYRDSCREVEGKLVKDLSSTGRDLKRSVIIDDNPNAYSFQPENAIPVRPFIDDLGDQELRRVTKFLETANYFEDMREAVAYYIPEVIKDKS